MELGVKKGQTYLLVLVIALGVAGGFFLNELRTKARIAAPAKKEGA